jgi:hypothetical protein
MLKIWKPPNCKTCTTQFRNYVLYVNFPTKVIIDSYTTKFYASCFFYHSVCIQQPM